MREVYDPDTWQCPCPECNGAVRNPFPGEDDDSMMEPEHPENVAPERWGYGARS